MSIRAQVINLLRDLQEELGIALVFISHDLSLVRLIADRVAVMYRGRVVEYGESKAVFEDPQHPYTMALVAAVPVPDPDHRHKLAETIEGAAADEQRDLVGCDYADRCPRAEALCWNEPPEYHDSGHAMAACHFAAGEVRVDVSR